MKIELITKDDKKIIQDNVKGVEFYGGVLNIVLTTNEAVSMPMYLISYFNITSI